MTVGCSTGSGSPRLKLSSPIPSLSAPALGYSTLGRTRPPQRTAAGSLSRTPSPSRGSVGLPSPPWMSHSQFMEGLCPRPPGRWDGERPARAPRSSVYRPQQLSSGSAFDSALEGLCQRQRRGCRHAGCAALCRQRPCLPDLLVRRRSHFDHHRPAGEACPAPCRTLGCLAVLGAAGRNGGGPLGKPLRLNRRLPARGGVEVLTPVGWLVVGICGDGRRRAPSSPRSLCPPPPELRSGAAVREEAGARVDAGEPTRYSRAVSAILVRSRRRPSLAASWWPVARPGELVAVR